MKSQPHTSATEKGRGPASESAPVVRVTRPGPEPTERAIRSRSALIATPAEPSSARQCSATSACTGVEEGVVRRGVVMKRRWDGGGEEVGEGEEAGGGGCSVRLHHPRRDEEGRYGEIWGDVGRYPPAPPAPRRGGASRAPTRRRAAGGASTTWRARGCGSARGRRGWPRRSTSRAARGGGLSAASAGWGASRRGRARRGRRLQPAERTARPSPTCPATRGTALRRWP